MFWNRSKNRIKFSVKLDIRVNCTELSSVKNNFDYLENLKPLNDESMTKSWTEKNCSSFNASVLFTFGLNGDLFVVSSGEISSDNKFALSFPCTFNKGRDSIDVIQNGDFFTFSFLPFNVIEKIRDCSNHQYKR